MIREREVKIGCALVLLALAASTLRAVTRAASAPPKECSQTGRPPRTHPDYNGVVMPPNIAPLNFVVDEPGERCFVRAFGEKGRPIRVDVRGRSVRFPARAWRSLLAANRGGEIGFDVYVRAEGGSWQRFETMRSRVAPDEIDSHLVYRVMTPIFNRWGDLGIYQRDLTTFDERPVLANSETSGGCVNCHTFRNNDPDTFLMHVRPGVTGPAMIVARDGRAERVDTRTKATPRAAGYSSWHPSGKLIAFSWDHVCQFFHTAGAETREVVDLDAGIALYWVDRKAVSTAPDLDRPDQVETFPGWSADGKHLYYCTAPIPWPERKPIPHDHVRDVRCAIVRSPFDVETGKWGPPETVVSPKVTGKSALTPRISPDGRFLLFVMCDYSAFAPFQRRGDLYVADLQAPGFPMRRLDAESESERAAWHSWSSNSRWIAYARKKEVGFVARPFLRYIDAEGKAGKPLVVPQEDPEFYDRCINTYNVPELVKGAVRINQQELARAANAEHGTKAVAEP